MKRLFGFGVLALAGLLLAFLVPSLAAAQTAQTINLTESEFMISPMTFTATQNQPVHFVVTNAGKFPHSVTFVHGTKFVTLFKAPLKGGTSGEADFTFTEGGTWQMYCPVGSHAEAGMTGSVQVLSTAPGMPSTGVPAGSEIPLLGLVALGLLGGGVLLRRRRSSSVA